MCPLENCSDLEPNTTHIIVVLVLAFTYTFPPVFFKISGQRPWEKRRNSARHKHTSNSWYCSTKCYNASWQSGVSVVVNCRPASLTTFYMCNRVELQHFVQMKWPKKQMTKRWKTRDCHVQFLLAVFVHHNISDQAVVLSSAGLQQDTVWAGGVCVYISEAWCLGTHQMSWRFPRDRTVNMNMLTM